MSLTIINDTHNGVVRSGGTTPKTAWALRQWVLARFRDLLSQIDTDLLILGDLLDAYMIPYLDLLEVISALQEWLEKNPTRTLFLVPGNHDLSKTISTMSSFQFLCRIMGSKRVVVLSQPGRLRGHDGYVIPHVVNQEQFDIELTKVPDDVGTLYVHCNYDNKFAQQADHSLNLSAQQARNLPVKRIVFAHEHQHKTSQGGKVLVIGNQIPSSVADCLNNTHKFKLVVDGTDATLVPVWDRAGAFIEMNWQELTTTPPDVQFVRVVGDAAAGEANAVVSTISKLRGAHNAFVITNAVKIEGRSTDIEARSLEQAQSYDVREAVMRRLTPAQQVVVKELLAEHGEA